MTGQERSLDKACRQPALHSCALAGHAAAPLGASPHGQGFSPGGRGGCGELARTYVTTAKLNWTTSAHLPTESPMPMRPSSGSQNSAFLSGISTPSTRTYVPLLL